MLALFKKEIQLFLNSLLGYFIMILFLLFISLFLWVFPTNSYNIIELGYASLNPLFYIAPWIFMFLIPAITMRLFSEEKRTGTIEFLFTKPLSDWQIILAKYFSGYFLVFLSIIPTLVYYVCIYYIGLPKGNIDTPGVIGSYIGLLLLSAGFTSIGIFTSAITNNPIISFLLGVFLCYITYEGFDMISSLPFLQSADHLIQTLGISQHYVSLSRGVIDTRDVLYFMSLSYIFLLCTKIILEQRKWQ